MKNLFFASVLALAAATPAFAQDDAPAADTSFTGPWVAAIGGIDVLTIQENDEADAARGPLFGGAIGYDFNAGSVVVGIEGEVTSSSADFDVEDILVNGDTLELKSGRDIYAGARVGWRTGGTLLYVKGGYVNAQHKSVYDDHAGTRLEETEDKGGFRVGIGAEFGREGFFGKVEMRYQDVGEFTVFSTPTGYARTNFHGVAGVGYRF